MPFTQLCTKYCLLWLWLLFHITLDYLNEAETLGVYYTVMENSPGGSSSIILFNNTIENFKVFKSNMQKFLFQDLVILSKI